MKEVTALKLIIFSLVLLLFWEQKVHIQRLNAINKEIQSMTQNIEKEINKLIEKRLEVTKENMYE